MTEELETWFAQREGALVAFSGGVDSSLVAALALKFLGAEKTLAVISASPSLKRSDLAVAHNFAAELGLPLRVIVTDELAKSSYADNPIDRCFYCKSTLYEDLAKLKQTSKFARWSVLNGTNMDDLGDYRPGLEAASQFQVESPLADCGLNKADVRALAKELNLPTWDKPASPCLASRIPYGERVTFAKLKQIEEAESLLYDSGFAVCRVRHYGTKAKIEVPREQLGVLDMKLPKLEKQFGDLGFNQVEIDTEGFRSGKLNDVLNKAK